MRVIDDGRISTTLTTPPTTAILWGSNIGLWA
jgi:hypothetical protein